MMNHILSATPNDPVYILHPEGRSSVIVVCEHASCFIPPEFGNLGLDDDALKSHIAWDPGALDVALGLAKRLDAKLVTSPVSRLVYDCNRPPTSPDAMPIKSETIEVPGNMNLSTDQRDARVAQYYTPFRASVAAVVESTPDPIIVTVHSFTPIYNGTPRTVEIGILHDSDARLANAMGKSVATHTDAIVGFNEPYGPQDGVTHTLTEHAIDAGHLNVMLEIRNDLIDSPRSQDEMAARLATWIGAALADLNDPVGAQC